MGDAAEGADEVDLDDPVEGIEREMLDAAVFLAAARGLDRVAGARAVDENAFLAVRFARLGEGGVDRRVVGDVAFDEVAEVAGAISPSPGGVGPMTITMLLANTLKAAQNLTR